MQLGRAWLSDGEAFGKIVENACDTPMVPLDLHVWKTRVYLPLGFGT
jgi:hypothetical protein